MKTTQMAWAAGEPAFDSAELSPTQREYIRRHPRWQKLYLSTIISGILADRAAIRIPVQGNVWSPSALIGNAAEPEARRLNQLAQELLAEGVPGLFPANPICPVTGDPFTIDYVCSADHHSSLAQRQIAAFKAGAIDILIGDQMTRTGIDNLRAKWALDFHDHARSGRPRTGRAAVVCSPSPLSPFSPHSHLPTPLTHRPAMTRRCTTSRSPVASAT